MVSCASIVVTAVGAISAFGPDVSSLWQGVVQGRRGFGPIRAFDTAGCRVAIAAEAPEPVLPTGVRQTASVSRTAALALHAAWQARERSGYSQNAGHRLGLVLGSTGGGTASLEAYLTRCKERGPARTNAVRVLGFPKFSATDFVGSSLGITGPRHTINTACSSGAVAIAMGAELLRAGLCDAVLAGGADELLRYTLTGFCSLRAVDPEPCRPFDRQRKGMTLGEGAGFVFLERETEARRRGAAVLARLAGTGHSCDAGHLTAPDAQGRGAIQAMKQALNDAKIDPKDLAFINAHGTGTPLNDAAEVNAVRTLLGAHASRCWVHTIKACVGHCMGAAGTLEAITTIESLRHRLVPPTPGLTEPEAELHFSQQLAQPIQGAYGLSNSFGFGGNNAALVFACSEVSS